MKKIIPIILLVIGVAVGGGAGLFLRPADTTGSSHENVGDTTESAKIASSSSEDAEPAAFVKMNNQFVVPIVGKERVRSLVVLSVSLKVLETNTDAVYNREPLLRDAFLQVLFNHSALGGFDGVYTSSENMDRLKERLLKTAQELIGPEVQQVLITDIVRQDL